MPWAELIKGGIEGLGAIRTSGTSSSSTMIVALAGVAVLGLLVALVIWGGDRK